MKPIRKHSAEELTTDTLRQEILSGRLLPAARLTEMDLSSTLGVSRATVRSALQHLVREGLVTQVPYIGSAVTTLTAKDAWELYTLRACFEGMAAQLAAQRLNRKGKTRVEHVYQRLCKAAGDGLTAELTEADFAFHQEIVLLAEHGRLAQQYNLVEQQVRMSIRSTNSLLTELSLVVEQHRPIAHAILEGRSDDARQLAEQHNHSEGEKLVKYLESYEVMATSATAEHQQKTTAASS